MLQNLRYAFRTWRDDPGVIVTILLTLALGIGANTAVFSVDYATLIAPLPYPNPEQLVAIWSQRQGERKGVSAGDFADWKQQSTASDDLNAWTGDDFNLVAGDKLEYVQGMDVTPGYNGMLGSPLMLGRNFQSEEGTPGKEHVVILSHRLWQRLGANPKVIGQTIRINSSLYTVVGVMAPGSADRRDEQLMIPLVLKPADLANHDFRAFGVVGRLRPGVSIKQVQAEMDVVAAHLAREHPKTNEGWGALVEPLKNDFLPGERQRTLWLLFGATGFLLLIACVNVATLLLAKGVARQREVAIRGSLGAKPSTIFAQFLTESVVLGLAGGALGVVAGYALLSGLVAAMPPHILPPEADLRLNIPILLYMLAAATLAGVLFGCTPAWYASRVDPARAMKEGGVVGLGVSHHRLRRILTVGQFALSLALLAGAGLSLHSFWNLTHIDLGIRTDHTFAFYLVPQALPRGAKQIDINSYYGRILASIEAVPGVSHAAAMAWLPLEDLGIQMPFEIAGKAVYANPSLRPDADFQMATPDYFQAFGMRVVAGRAFTGHDNASSMKVVIVNEAFVNKFLKGVDPLRQRVVMEQQIPGEPKLGPAVERQIVGVFHNVKTRGSREDYPEIVVPFWQEAFSTAGIAVRTFEDPAAIRL